MTPVDVLFLLVWAALAFVVARLLAVRASAHAPAANAVAAAVALAFLLGSASPFALRVAGIHVAPPSPTPVPPVTKGRRAAGPVAQTDGARVQPLGACRRGARLRANGFGSIDVLEVLVGREPVEDQGKMAVGTRQGLRAIGWAAAPGGKGLASAVCPEIDGTILAGADVLYGWPRGDVVQVLGNPGLLATGYTLTLPPGTLPRGSHRFGVVALAGGRPYLLGERQLEVR